MYEHNGPQFATQACEAQSPESPIATEVKGIHQGQETTNELLSRLSGRLKSVLNNGGVKGQAEIAPKSTSLSPLHGDLSSAGERQQAINNRLHDLIDRLTV